MSKQFIPLLSLIACFFMSCSVKPASEALIDQLDIYMSEYEEQTYHVYLYEQGKYRFLDIKGAPFYIKHLTDGYFFHKDKLVTYCFLDNKRQEDVIHVENTNIFADTIFGYEAFDAYNSIEANVEVPPSKDFLVTPDGNLTLLTDDRTMKRDKMVTDCSVILNAGMNEIINEVINNDISDTYIIRIKKWEGDYYFTVSPTLLYDSRHTVGYFYRQGLCMIIFSDSRELQLKDMTQIFDISQVSVFKDSIDKLRDYYMFFSFQSEKRYKLIKDTIEDVSDDLMIMTKL